MNYIELINQFWRLDSERPFQASDSRLYFYLLHSCNRLGWKNPFSQSDRYLAAHIGSYTNTVRDAINRLIEAGLIEVSRPKKPSKGIHGQSLYFIKTLSTSNNHPTAVGNSATVVNTVVDTVPEAVLDVVSATNNKQNKKETKTIISLPEKIKNDFLVFDQTIKSKFPNVSKLEQQMTPTEFITLQQEFKISAETMNDILERMENYKPLKKNSRSVYFTIRSWHKKDIAHGNTENNNYSKNTSQNTSMMLKTNEGPTL